MALSWPCLSVRRLRAPVSPGGMAEHDILPGNAENFWLIGAQLCLVPRGALWLQSCLCLPVRSCAVSQDVALQAGFHSRVLKVFVLLLPLAL